MHREGREGERKKCYLSKKDEKIGDSNSEEPGKGLEGLGFIPRRS